MWKIALFIVGVYFCEWSICKELTYNLEVHTSAWLWAGTDETIGFRLLGDKGNTEWTYVDPHNYNGKNVFEYDTLDRIYVKGQDIGNLLDIEVTIKQVGYLLDRWIMSWIKLTVNGATYKAYYWKSFTRNNQLETAKKIEIVECAPGYECIKNPVKGTKMKKICRDVNECVTTCKGFEQVCKNQPGGYTCSCRDGLQMIGGECIDINECVEHRNATKCAADPNSKCANTIGSYECTCQKGFSSPDFPTLCKDINECEVGTDNCQHKCINIDGSFNCTCRDGFRLAPNGFSCVDANECDEARNPCDNNTSQCFDVLGGYKCLCKHGYKSVPNTHLCERVTCGAVSIRSDNLDVSPSRCLQPGASKKGEKCHFSCKKGHKLHRHSMAHTVCSKYGSWESEDKKENKYEPLCIPTRCNPMKDVDNGYIVPNSCITSGVNHNGKCSFYCKQGYYLEGVEDVKCFDQKFEYGFKKPVCRKEPTIECPNDITVSLPKDKSTVQLGERYYGPTTNMEPNHVTSIPANVSGSYHFSLGSNLVQMIATNGAGHRVECSYIVTVKDTTPPVVKFCPLDVYYKVKESNQVMVEWPEPIFEDNVGIKVIRSSQKNKKLYSPVTFNVVYDAIDANNNIAMCRFKVVIEVISCSFHSIEGGDQITSKKCSYFSGRSMCFLDCPIGKTLSKIPPGKTMKNTYFCSQGTWYHQLPTDTVQRLPDCVDFTPMVNNSCPFGFVETYDSKSYTNVKVCGKCPRGTNYQASVSEAPAICLPCPERHYQDEEGQTTCKKCPVGTGNVKTRNIDVNACETLCEPGTYSRTGFPRSSDGKEDKHCHPCPINTYMAKYGALSCHPCPPGKITEYERSASVKHCIDIPIEIAAYPSINITAKAGETVKFQCTAFSMLSLAMSWDPPCHTSIQAGTSHKVEAMSNVREGSVGTEYIITNAHPSNSGEYTCKVVNKFGSLRMTKIHVNVLPKPF